MEPQSAQINAEQEKVQRRLREMTVPQLTSRWKRIRERAQSAIDQLSGPVVNLALDQLQDSQPEDRQPEDNQLGTHPWPILEAAPSLNEQLLHYQAALLEEPTDDSAPSLLALQRQLGQELLGLSLAHEPASSSWLKKNLDSSSQSQLEKLRELDNQRQWVEQELKDRGAELPQDGPPMALELPSIDTGKTMEKAGEYVNRVGEEISQVGKGLGARLSEATKNLAGRTAKASGSMLWSATKSAFNYTTTGPKKPAVPVVKRRRRRGRENSQADETLALIEKLFELKERGIISEDEFQTKKADLLERL